MTKILPAQQDGMDNEFPARTVIILTLSITLNSYTLVNLFPYVGLMVKQLLELESTNELGYYAGYIASAFTFGRFVTSYSLGGMADSIGRKPMIIGGLLSMMIFSLAFGLSPSFGFAVASRLLLGLTNGIVPALRTTIRETCGDEHVLEGMTYLGGGKGASLVLGTGIGGLLAQPAVNFPHLFSDSGIFGQFPFLLPNLVGAIAALVLLPVLILYIPETKHFEERRSGNISSRGKAAETAPEEMPNEGETSGCSHVTGRVSLSYQPMTDGGEGGDIAQQRVRSRDLELQNTSGSNSTAVAVPDRGEEGDGTVSNGQEEPGTWGPEGLLAVPNVKMLLFLICVTQAVLIGFQEAFPLWALSTPDVGGLAWGTVEIGKAHTITGSNETELCLNRIISCPSIWGQAVTWASGELYQVMLTAGVIVAVIQLVVFPRLIKVLKVTICQRVGCLLAIPAFAFVPYTKGLSWNDSSLFVLSVASTTAVYGSMAMGNAALTIASTTMVHSHMRGKLGGLFNMAASLGRTLGPAGSATLFAWSISGSSCDWVGNEFVFLAAALSMCAVAVLAWRTITDENVMRSA